MRWKRRKMREMRSRLMFGACTVISGAAAMFGINVLPVMAKENAGEEMVVNDAAADVGAGVDAAGELSESSWGGVSKSGNTAEDENLGVYDFKDNKTSGTVTVTKVWDDDKTNEERAIPDIKISTAKPGKNPLGYTITFHGNKDAGLVFDDGSDINNVVYNSSGQIVDGVFKAPGGWAARAVSWFTDKALTNKVDVSESGTVQMSLSGDIDLWGKTKTFEIKGYNGNSSRKYNDFNYLIPDTVTEIFFTDEIKPENASVIDVDTDGDGGVVAWTENGGTVMKVSTQIKGVKVQAAKNSSYMFIGKNKIKTIDLTALNTANVTDMRQMFDGCSDLTSLDLTSLNTENVTYMGYMFDACHGLTNLDLTPFDTENVTDMGYMFNGCSGLTSLDLTSFNTSNVTNMGFMFSDCSGLTNLNLAQFNTKNVTNMKGMFYKCSGLTNLDLTPFDTANVTDMRQMFNGCSGLTSLDLTSFDTTKVMSMFYMFSDCSSLTSLNLTSFDITKVTNMYAMFQGCSSLISLDLTSFNTSNVTNMGFMFSGCSGLTSLDLTPLNTAKVTSMVAMFSGCRCLTSITTGTNFKFIGTNYYLSGTWRNTAGETFNGNNSTANFPSNIADTYTKISN